MGARFTHPDVEMQHEGNGALEQQEAAAQAPPVRAPPRTACPSSVFGDSFAALDHDVCDASFIVSTKGGRGGDL